MNDYRKIVEKIVESQQGYNCAQVVLKTFQEVLSVDEATIAEFKKFGGGRAENNTCGAIFAATQLLPKQQKQLLAKFEQRVETLRCKELKEQGKFSCLECMKVAAETVAEEL